MTITHSIAVLVNEQVLREFLDAGVKLEPQSSEYFSPRAYLKITEDDPRWGKVSILKQKYCPLQGVDTTFTKEELHAAVYLDMWAQSSHGYPMPDDDFGYMRQTYDVTAPSYCPECSVGAVQQSPFRMRGEPNWGKRSIMQLNWVFDEYFVTPETWEQVFKPMGIGMRPVVKHSNNVVLQTVVQLDVQELVDVKIPEDTIYETCSVCGKQKPRYTSRGYSPRPLQTPTSAMFKSRQYFGSGGGANHLVMVTQKLYRAITEAKLRGVEFKVCEPE